MKSYDINRTLKTVVLKKKMVNFFDNMKDRKKIEILLKVIARVYTKSPGMQKMIDRSMKDICKEEGVSLE